MLRERKFGKLWESSSFRSLFFYLKTKKKDTGWNLCPLSSCLLPPASLLYPPSCQSLGYKVIHIGLLLTQVIRL
jgi:hypothetical protein